MLHIEVIPELYHKNLWKYKAEGNVNVVLAFIGKNERFIVWNRSSTSKDNY